MFKFKIIDNNQQNQKISPLPSNTMNLLQEKKGILDETGTTTLLIIDTAEQEVIGSMSLIKRKINQLEEHIRILISTKGDFRNDVREGSSLYLAPLRKSREFSHFYRAVYAGFVEFGLQKNVGFIVLKLTADVYLMTKMLGLWPYVIEFPPKESFDEFFYGVLPLKGSLYNEYQEKWEKLDRKK